MVRFNPQKCRGIKRGILSAVRYKSFGINTYGCLGGNQLTLRGYMYYPCLSPEALHSVTRTAAGLLSSTRCELLFDAGTFFLLTSDFFSMTLSPGGTRLPTRPHTKVQAPTKGHGSHFADKTS
jgi:hypothetical protein